MNLNSKFWIVVLGLAGLVLLSATGCFSLPSSKAKPNYGSDGIPVFEGKDFMHRPDHPYVCYSYALSNGSEKTDCAPNARECGVRWNETKMGSNVLRGCTEYDEVTCRTVFISGRTPTSCTVSKQECENRRERDLEAGVSSNQTTRCTTLDRSWTPFSAADIEKSRAADAEQK